MNERFEPNEEGSRPLAPTNEVPANALTPRGSQELSRDVLRREDAEDDDDFNILEYIHLLWRQRWVILGVAAIVTALGATGTLLMTPLYRATATIQIERDALQVVTGLGVEFQETGGGDFYQTQYELLQSRALAQRVVRDTNLGADPEMLRLLTRPSPVQRLRNLVFGEEAAPQIPDQETRERIATGRVMAGVTVTPVRGSRLVALSFDSQAPQLSQRVANAYATSFIALNLERRYGASDYARTFLEDRLAELKLNLEESERELIAYAREQEIINVGDNQSLVGSNLTSLNAALGEARANRIRAEGLWRQAQATDGLGLPQILASPSIQVMRQQKATLESEYQQNLSVFQPAYPAMQQRRAQIEEIDRQIEAEVTNIKESIRAEYEAAQVQEVTLQEQVGGLTGDVLSLNDRSVQYNILQREVETNRQIYDALLQRYGEVGVASGVGTNNMSVVDEALTPGAPYTPNIPFNIAIALFVGLAGGVMMAFVTEHIDNTVKSPEDVERILGLTLLGVVPRLDSKTSLNDALNDQRSSFSEAYRSLRTSLQFSTAEGTPKTLFVTSPRPGEGKTTTAVTLALNFVQLGKSVLLIDADLRNPSLHRILGCNNGAGLSSYLSGAQNLSEAVQEVKSAGLHFLPSGPLPPNPAELLAGPKMLSLLSLGSAKFDLLIIDGPPVMGLADAPILSSMIGGSILVIEAAQTPQALAKASVQRLRHARAAILGAVLTKFEAKHASYGYGYGYGYGGENHYTYGGRQQIEGGKAQS